MKYNLRRAVILSQSFEEDFLPFGEIQAERFKNPSDGFAQVRVLSGGEVQLKSEGVGERI